MVLLILILILMAGGIASWIVASSNATTARWIALLSICADFIATLAIWIANAGHATSASQRWFTECNFQWIPQFGIRLHLAIDGLSLVMLLLTYFLGIMAILCSWTEIRERAGFFHFNLLWVLAGITGVFLSMDLFLFYLFWELMLVPMYLLIGIWGHERRIYAATKFFLFTQLSGLLMLVAIISLAVIHRETTGVLTFDYEQLLGTALQPNTALLLMLGFFIAFAVKLPIFPLHTWLPDAHTEAPTAGSVILAGLLLKTGAYGLIRFVLPLFPEASHRLAPLMMTIGVIGILYGAVLAVGQTDLKRLVAYTSVSHMGFVLLGIFAGNEIALEGAVVQMVSHGISTGALFIMAGLLQERMHTREIGQMGGLWETMPSLSGAGLVFAMASLGLPGLGDFVGEFLVLLGAYRANVSLTVVATLGLLAATLYGLRLGQNAFQGPNPHHWKLPDMSFREWAILGPMMICLLWLGLYPQPVLNAVRPSLAASAQQSAQLPDIVRR
ncbi:MAG TPA: NADH-quinone oxidoreductase subunit M [Alloacidobacterium sp.]|nr:NADH-quinone oxidoreductase subunit M [Alloacidobacterium sp.]